MSPGNVVVPYAHHDEIWRHSYRLLSYPSLYQSHRDRDKAHLDGSPGESGDVRSLDPSYTNDDKNELAEANDDRYEFVKGWEVVRGGSRRHRKSRK